MAATGKPFDPEIFAADEAAKAQGASWYQRTFGKYRDLPKEILQDEHALKQHFLGIGYGQEALNHAMHDVHVDSAEKLAEVMVQGQHDVALAKFGARNARALEQARLSGLPLFHAERLEGKALNAVKKIGTGASNKIKGWASALGIGAAALAGGAFLLSTLNANRKPATSSDIDAELDVAESAMPPVMPAMQNMVASAVDERGPNYFQNKIAAERGGAQPAMMPQPRSSLAEAVMAKDGSPDGAGSLAV